MKFKFRRTIILVATLVAYSTVTTLAQTITFTYDANGNCTSKRINGTQPLVRVTGDTVMCKGAIAKFTATGADGYLWDIGGTGSTVSIVADTTRSYVVVGTNNNSGCKDTVYHLLKVIAAPDSNAIWGDTVAQINSTDTFRAPFFSGSDYRWAVTGGNIISGNGTPEIEVQWGNLPGAGMVELYQSVGTQQCKGKTVFHNVNIKDYPQSIEKLAAIGDLKVFPNPSTNGVNIHFTPAEKSGCEIQVISADGKVIYKDATRPQTKYNHYLEDRVFPSSGIYTIKIISNTGELSEKLVYIKN